MSLEEIRDRNVVIVTEKALECFVEKGIANTKVADVAKAAGLTERSVFRYFPNKSDMVVAAAFLYWEKAKTHTAKKLAESAHPGMTGIEEISLILNGYTSLLHDDPKGIRFSLDAEVVLYGEGKNNKVVNRPPERFETHSGPLAVAISRGLADGTVDKNADLKQLYYNAYDSILGLMQRLTVGVPSTKELDERERLEQMCDMFTREFAANKNFFK